MVTLYRTFALYEEKLEFNVLHGRVPEYTTGDVKIAAVIDGVSSSTIPGKNDGYVVESINCDNGADALWDSDTWRISIGNLTKTKTTCTIAFKKFTFIDYITTLADTNNELSYDGTADNNLRYVGADPNNYVLFNNELWRVIGVMNNITDGEGNIDSHIKLIRTNSIGNYAWDNKGTYGNNDWTQSALMEVLNSGAYWNRASGTCPSGANGATTPCDFSSTGLTSESKSMISNVVWNLGALTTPYEIASTLYNSERGTNAYNGNPIKWTGNVGLIYMSDFIFAIGGDMSTTCQNVKYYDDYGCYELSWMYSASGDNKLTITTSSSQNSVIDVNNLQGQVYPYGGGYLYEVFPTVYLDHNVYFTGGTGTSSNPYKLKLGS